MARLSRPKCDSPVLLGSVTIVSTRIIPLFFFALPQFTGTRGTTSYGICWLSILAPFSYYQRDGIEILAQGGARHNVPEHDFVDASDFAQLTSVAFLEEEEALAATAVSHLSRESIQGIVEPRF